MINVREFVEDKICTESIQKAIDYAAANKKVLLFPRGVYCVTSLQLKSDSAIYLEKDAVISASLNEKDWEKTPLTPVILCEDASNISIRGAGTITANGYAFVDEEGYINKVPSRPGGVILFKNVSNIIVENLTLKETVGWTLHLDNCDDVLIDGIIIRNPTYVTRKNSDGIDINGCRNVTIMNCDIETGDDAICLKNIDRSTLGKRNVDNHDVEDFKRNDMYNINVYNCTLASTCNSTKIGTETVGNIYDVSFEKITVKRHQEITKDGAGAPPYDSHQALTAISVQSNDGAVVKNIRFKDYYVEAVYAPVFILYQQRSSFIPASNKGEVSNVIIENMYVKKTYKTSQILSSEPGKINDIRMSDVYVHSYEEPCDEYTPLLPTGKEYPDPYNFGNFPSYGIYAANVDELCIDESVKFIDEAHSGRTSVVIN